MANGYASFVRPSGSIGGNTRGHTSGQSTIPLIHLDTQRKNILKSSSSVRLNTGKPKFSTLVVNVYSKCRARHIGMNEQFKLSHLRMVSQLASQNSVSVMDTRSSTFMVFLAVDSRVTSSSALLSSTMQEEFPWTALALVSARHNPGEQQLTMQRTFKR